MDIWKGSVSLPPNSPLDTLEDIHLSTPSVSPPIASSLVSHLKNHLSDSTLSFLSYVDPNRIPLFLATGPSLTVTTTSTTTENFFQSFFRSALPTSVNNFSIGNPEQSQIALLLRVTPDSSKDVAKDDSDWGITELCFYGSVTYPTVPTDTLALTPPNSSPDCDPLPPQAVVTVYALPLSSHHAFPRYMPQAKLESATDITTRPTTPASTPIATFIAPNPQETLNPSISRSAKKRRADALDAAVEKRKKSRRTMSAPPPPLTLLGKSAVNSRLTPITPREDSVDRVLSRSSIKAEPRSPSPAPLSTLPRRPSLAPLLRRPATISGPLIHRAASVMSERPTSSQSMMARPKTPGQVKPKPEWGEIEARNRESLNRVVVLVMKEHGLRDYRKERTKSVLLGELIEDKENAVGKAAGGNMEDEKEREDYKMVFHHTVKAAAFALRDVIERESVDMTRIRSVVERLVGVFCEGRPSTEVKIKREESEDKENSRAVAKDSLRKQLEAGEGFAGLGDIVISPETAGDIIVL